MPLVGAGCTPDRQPDAARGAGFSTGLVGGGGACDQHGFRPRLVAPAAVPRGKLGGASSGVFGRTVRWVPTARVQSVSLLQPLWQRRLGLASLDVRAAGGRITLPWMPREQAERWRDELLCEVASGDIL
ncbi:PH domain-containing protein [Halomonas sp. TBZ9]|uniref:PH domain-containing protein n=1 Tax=Vreelandella azerica TaxID=2732867 RepID=A0A7Y3TXR5_9GAMM|nr:PH domain-containing protein [Halomonas azerica]